MNLEQLLGVWERDPAFRRNVTAWQKLPAAPARYGVWPEILDPRLREALAGRGIQRPYTHQADAIAAALQRQNAVVVTPTASGKTLCYNLPVLNAILADPSARAIYLFPTKALGQDQVAELQALVERTGADIKAFTYDGDTPVPARQAIRAAGHIVVTNPDMLHTGVLPHHTRWVKLFENLRYVVIDELHHYRGVFGSHLANVLRRLRRLCRFYGSDPAFICCSATIANPDELAERLTGTKMRLIDQSGAPRGEKHLIFYNPPVVNPQLGIRRSALLEARRLGAALLKNEIQTILFARTRVSVEVLLSYLKEAAAPEPGGPDRDPLGGIGPSPRGGRGPVARGDTRIRGYRGGYLSSERRAIEAGLRSGEVLGVVSTNALELGIDIGQLEAAVLVGYPGTVASTWQQAGRAGRRATTSLALTIATSSPLDQFIVRHPEYFFGLNPESGLVNPDNLQILVNHVKCAAFELPFTDDESFGEVEGTGQVLQYLEDERILRHSGGRWHWMNENFPAEGISLRSAAAENFVIIDTTQPAPRVIGETDRIAAMTTLHKDAIYIHEGRQYHVDELNWEEKKAYVHAVEVDYYTDANLAVSIRVLEEFKQAAVGTAETAAGAPSAAPASRHLGEVGVDAMATIFKKIKLHTHEAIGWGKIHLPEDQMHTSAYWLSLRPELTTGMAPNEIESALVGMGSLFAQIAPVYLMCDPKDLRSAVQVRSPFTELPTLYLYDAYPGGIGLAEKLFECDQLVFQAALELLSGCPCESGCPSCVGPDAISGEHSKRLSAGVLRRLLDAGG